MASTQPPATTWRAAWLRGIAAESGGPRAVVALSAEQFLLLPLREHDVARWRTLVGRRVWVDMDAQPMLLRADAVTIADTHHA